MKNLIGFTALATTLVATSGCAQWTHFYKREGTAEYTTTSMDMKQRLVVSSEREYVGEVVTGADGHLTKKVMKRTVVCAEPSPDALSAIAAQLSGGIDAAKAPVEARLAVALQESASFVGMRTPTIQLLRDSMYRLCEGFLAGALTEGEYAMHMRRYQRDMVALSAIEQLTGTLRAPTVVLKTGGVAETGESLSRIEKQLVAAGEEKAMLTKKKDEANQEKAALEAEAAKPGAPKDDVRDQKIVELGKTAAGVDEQVKNVDRREDALREGLKTVRGYVAGGIATGEVSSIAAGGPRDGQLSQEVVDAVMDIVLTTLQADDLVGMCYALLSAPAPRVTLKTGATNLEAMCKAHFAALADGHRERVKVQQGIVTALTATLSDSALDAEEKTLAAARLISLFNAMDMSGSRSRRTESAMSGRTTIAAAASAAPGGQTGGAPAGAGQPGSGSAAGTGIPNPGGRATPPTPARSEVERLIDSLRTRTFSVF